jgi:hypothetical protein
MIDIKSTISKMAIIGNQYSRPKATFKESGPPFKLYFFSKIYGQNDQWEEYPL